MKKQIAPYSLRVPGRIMEWLTKSAKRNNRSVGSEINFQLSNAQHRSYSEHDIDRFKQESPTKNNDEVFQFRINKSIKESLRITAKLHKNSLNQEIVMHLFYTYEDQNKPSTTATDVSDDTAINFEDRAILKLLQQLSEKNKKAVINLIRDLNE